jgi:HK97 family phage major capsid protein
MSEVKEAVDGIKTSFEEYKRTNDARLKAVEEGKSTADFDEKLAKIETDLQQMQDTVTKAQRLPQRGDRDGKSLSREELAHKQAFIGGFIRKGRDNGLSELEQKAMNVSSDPDGGYLVPVDSSGRIITKLYETSPMRQICRVETISAGAMEGPIDDDEADSGGWVSEMGTRSETGTPQIGKWKITPEEHYAQPKTTQTLLDDAMWDVEGWLERKIAEKLGRVENSAFVIGNGTGKPRGFTTYANGTARGTVERVLSGANGGFAAAKPGDYLIDLVYRLKSGYRQNAQFVMGRLTVAECRKLKDGQNNYLWQPDFTQRQSGSLLGYGITEAEDMPALAAGSLSLAFGDFREAYTVVDRMGIRVLRDPFTSKPWVKFYTTKRTGGDLVNFEAIKLMEFSAP